MDQFGRFLAARFASRRCRMSLFRFAHKVSNHRLALFAGQMGKKSSVPYETLCKTFAWARLMLGPSVLHCPLTSFDTTKQFRQEPTSRFRSTLPYRWRIGSERRRPVAMFRQRYIAGKRRTSQSLATWFSIRPSRIAQFRKAASIKS
jgi:hypothetical protein